ncbi:MAG: cupin domain-containing protein [Planctomycetota bacterium]|nr:cupin domain-containing protein [Planctomycetota bacterium]
MTAPTTLFQPRAGMPRRALEQCHGGTGALDFTEVLGRTPGLEKKLAFIHDDVLAPGVSIGEHRHEGDEEYYFIVSGRGTMTLDGKRVEVQAGDLTAIYPGGSHALENTSGEDLRILVICVKH